MGGAWTPPDAAALTLALAEGWRPAESARIGGWLVRWSAAAGKRPSAIWPLGDPVTRLEVHLFDFTGDAKVDLRGRETGANAGFVVLAARENKKRFKIDSTHVERLDGGPGAAALDLAHAGREVRGAAVIEVVAVDRGEHHVAQAHQLDGARGVGGLLGVEPAPRITGVHGAETAGAGAHLAHQHQRGGAGVPALADVRALGFLAHRGKPVLAHGAAHGVEARPGGHRRAQPARLASGR